MLSLRNMVIRKMTIFIICERSWSTLTSFLTINFYTRTYVYYMLNHTHRCSLTHTHRPPCTWAEVSTAHCSHSELHWVPATRSRGRTQTPRCSGRWTWSPLLCDCERGYWADRSLSLKTISSFHICWKLAKTKKIIGKVWIITTTTATTTSYA